MPLEIDSVCKHVRGNQQPFGGIQMLLSGDFFQLPPVPSPQYGDTGNYVFSSILIDFFHHINLTEIHRQKEEDFACTVRGVTRGHLERESLLLLKRLDRTLPPGDPPPPPPPPPPCIFMQKTLM
ncbi:ATP-dependent DNA helicase pfh1-like [Pecten maximus]|uniref:ATP-dependent DNA helicase pfh1-like n=1 Tax=Pecten maximus TaxID=6579 RepID=UPI0014584A87|nr:ATP-dependent DNA helicase pfh1-like [Pecten maximus]